MKKFLSILLSVAILLSFAVLAIGSGEDKTSTVEEQDVEEEKKETKQKKDLVVTVGKTLKTDNLKIDYLSNGEYTEYSQYSAPKSGYKIIYIDLKVENIGDEDEYVSYYDFKCYADDEAMEEYYSADDEINATISAGRSASGKAYFEVPINATEIEIEFEIDFLEGEKAIFIVK